MLTLENVVFQQGQFALGADLRVSPGTITAVIGPSGAGKSTLLHGIAGLVPVVSGDMSWANGSFVTAPPDRRPISMLFQDNNLFPHLTALQNVALALAPRLRLRPEDRDMAMEALDQVGLNGLHDRKPKALSGGQQSRVALARALLQDRPILLLDEPFSALGPAMKDEMLDLTARLAAGRTVMMVTHDPVDAERIADEIIGVSDGQAYAPIPAADFLANPPADLQTYFSRS